MGTADGEQACSAEELAREIQSSLQRSPLLVDILNEVKHYRDLGIPDDKIKTILEKSFSIDSQDEYTTTRDEEKDIVVNHLPDEYNQINWE